MISIQGIVLIEQGVRLMRWNNTEALETELEAIDGLIYDNREKLHPNQYERSTLF